MGEDEEKERNGGNEKWKRTRLRNLKTGRRVRIRKEKEGRRRGRERD